MTTWRRDQWLNGPGFQKILCQKVPYPAPFQRSKTISPSLFRHQKIFTPYFSKIKKSSCSQFYKSPHHHHNLHFKGNLEIVFGYNYLSPNLVIEDPPSSTILGLSSRVYMSPPVSLNVSFGNLSWTENNLL